MDIYGEDLSYIHEAGFGWFALKAAPGLLALLRKYGVDAGTVVDLGCGAGIWARQLGFAGYSAVGLDGSEAMIRRARKTAPAAHFVCADIMDADIPKCDAVTAIGEVLSYAFADVRLFRRVYRSLRRGGVFIIDVATPGRRPGAMRKKDFWQGEDWAALVDATIDDDVLTRTLTSFRKRGATWRRSLETHRLQLFDPSADLRAAGFEVRRLKGFGDLRFHAGHAGFLARKPI